MDKLILFLTITLGSIAHSWSGAIYSSEIKSAIIYYSTDTATVRLRHCYGVSEESVREIMEELKTNPYTFNRAECKSLSGAEVIERSVIDRNLSEMKEELARAFALSNQGEDEPEGERKLNESTDYFRFLTPVQKNEVEKLNTDLILKAIVDQAAAPIVVPVSPNKLQDEIKGLLRLAK